MSYYGRYLLGLVVIGADISAGDGDGARSREGAGTALAAAEGGVVRGGRFAEDEEFDEDADEDYDGELAEEKALSE